MDIISLRQRIERIIHTDSSVFAGTIMKSGFKCIRCGWCCRENFQIRITGNISRPSNAISIFPKDIRRIIKATGIKWEEAAEPDIYSCISDDINVWVIGWILKRNKEKNCVFYREGECTIYRWRPMICRCYPFFFDDNKVDIMHCKGLGNNVDEIQSAKLGLLLKRYEIKKLQNYINIIKQMGDILEISNLCSIPEDYSGTVLVCDGESITACFSKRCARDNGV